MKGGVKLTTLPGKATLEKPSFIRAKKWKNREKSNGKVVIKYICQNVFLVKAIYLSSFVTCKFRIFKVEFVLTKFKYETTIFILNCSNFSYNCSSFFIKPLTV